MYAASVVALRSSQRMRKIPGQRRLAPVTPRAASRQSTRGTQTCGCRTLVAAVAGASSLHIACCAHRVDCG
eukprot:3393639-Pleurochrysis_carterae.AAC.1